MPFTNVPEHLQDKMHRCVQDLKDQGKDEKAAVAICYTSVVEGKSLVEAIAAYEDVIKIGRRNSMSDQARLQMIHDYAVDNGAMCDDKPKSIDPETLITFGAEVKALGDGKIGGYLVRFGSPDQRDLTGIDWFGKDTDFGDAQKSDVYYHHGMDTKIGKRKLAEAMLRPDDVGVWAETQLKMRDEYEKAIYELAQKGKLGWSSGTAPHLVERDRTTGQIKKWPLGLDASLTPTPAEPRNTVAALKSLTESPSILDVPQAAQDNRDERTGETIPSNPNPSNKESTKMADETKPTPDPVPDYAAEIKTLKEAFAKLDSTLKAEKPEVKGFNISKTGIGDTEIKAFANWVRTGDGGAALKASNAVDMQEGTAAEGGNAVPTGHYQGIIARRNESMIAAKLGLMNIPGKGLTVNVPLDNEADGEFVSTNEESAFDVDTPALDVAAMTLVKYTKEMLLSYELLEDEDSKLMAFLDNWVGRGMAKTHNSLLVTAAASGTALKTFASASAIAVGELEPIVYNSNVTYYLDDTNSNAWIMRPSTYDAISRLGSTSIRYYAEQQQGSNTPSKLGPMLLGYPVYFSEKAAAVAASAKPVYFGNWSFMGYREAPGFTVLRDPYSNAHTGRLTLRYYFRCKYLVLQTAAIGYGVHPSA